MEKIHKDQIVEIFEKEYPELSEEFKKIRMKCMLCLQLNIWIMG